MPNQSLFGPASFLKKIPITNPFASQRASLARAAGNPAHSSVLGGPGSSMGGPQTPFAWVDEDFRKALGEAWTNNDLAAGYRSATNPAAPPGQSFGARTVQPAQNTPQSAWVKPAAPSQYGEVLGHPIEGFRKRPGSLF